MPRRFKTQRIKANKSYQVAELAETAGVSIQTIRNWIRAGMQRVDGNRPTIIMGFQALDYLKARMAKTRRPLALGEFYCLRCKAPRAALGAMAEYEPTSDTSGRLKALCDTCECACNRNVRASDLPAIGEVMRVAIRDDR